MKTRKSETKTTYFFPNKTDKILLMPITFKVDSQENMST